MHQAAFVKFKEEYVYTLDAASVFHEEPVKFKYGTNRSSSFSVIVVVQAVKKVTVSCGSGKPFEKVAVLNVAPLTQFVVFGAVKVIQELNPASHAHHDDALRFQFALHAHIIHNKFVFINSTVQLHVIVL